MAQDALLGSGELERSDGLGETARFQPELVMSENLRGDARRRIGIFGFQRVLALTFSRITNVRSAHRNSKYCFARASPLSFSPAASRK